MKGNILLVNFHRTPFDRGTFPDRQRAKMLFKRSFLYETTPSSGENDTLLRSKQAVSKGSKTKKEREEEAGGLLHFPRWLLDSPVCSRVLWTLDHRGPRANANLVIEKMSGQGLQLQQSMASALTSSVFRERARHSRPEYAENLLDRNLHACSFQSFSW